VALIHAFSTATPTANRIGFTDILAARASKKVRIATVERIVSNHELQALGGANVPYFYVAALGRRGAHGRPPHRLRYPYVYVLTTVSHWRAKLH
jgi:acyl CoA:acetate/3-ketoacid CoA transferase alpha subunit